MLLEHERALADPDAVLAAVLATQRESPRDDLAIQRPCAIQALGVRRHQNNGMKIAVADMPDDRRGQSD